MSEAGRHAAPLRWRRPTIAWAVMVAAFVLIVLLGLYAAGALRFYGGLSLSAFMLLTLAFGLVGFGRESALTRLVGSAAFLFIGLMFLLSFTDLLTRLR
jgi:hypothetical protein